MTVLVNYDIAQGRGQGDTATATAVARATNTVNVRNYGAKGDNSTDDTAAFVAAIAALGVNPGTVYVPQGNYVVTQNQIVLANAGQQLVGAGRASTKIRFAPTANGVCIKLGAATQKRNIALRHLTITSSDSTYVKIAIYGLELGSPDISNIEVAGTVARDGTNFWSSGTAGAGNATPSFGLVCDGHEMWSVRNVDIFADRPIVIGAVDNDGAEVLTGGYNACHWTDHYNFHNTYLIANYQPCFEILNGAFNVSQIIFSGTNAWVSGTYGFKWVRSAPGAISAFPIVFENIRTEQAKDASAYSIYIDDSISSVQNVAVKGCVLDIGRKGIYVRGVIQLNMENVQFPGTGEFLNAVAANSVYSLRGRQLNFNDAATVSLTNYFLLRGASKAGSTSQPMPSDCEYVYDNQASVGFKLWPTIGLTGNHMVKTGTLASGANVELHCGTNYGGKFGMVIACAHGATKDEGGTAFVTSAGNFLVGGTTNFGVGNVGGKLTVMKNGASTILFNQLGESVDYQAVVFASA